MRKILTAVALMIVAPYFFAGCSDGIDMDVVNVNNLNGATGVPIDSKFQYIASPAFDSSTVTGETYFIVPVTGDSASISAKAAMDDTICDLEGALPAVQSSAISTFFGLIPSGVLSYNTQYAICLTDGIAYENGSAFAGFMARFTTAESSSEVTTTLSPAEGATGVALDAAVTAVFSGEITEPADWNSLFTLKKDNAGDSLCTSVTYDSATLTATCEHADFEKASNCTASVSGITDIAGALIGTATAAFAAKTSVVISSIKILRLDGVELDLADRPIPRSARIQYTLGEALTEEADRAAFEAAIAVTDAEGAEVTGAYAWAADYLSTVFTPSSKLGYSTEYTLTVDEGSLPVAGLSLSVGVQQTFTTMAYRDINGDGYADSVVGASGVAGGAENGAAYVFLGSVTGIADCTIGGTCTSLGTTITGQAADDVLGGTVSTAGDVNGDGYEDLIVGAPGGWLSGKTGWAYVFLGSAEGIADCDLSGSCIADTTITGAAAADSLGSSVSVVDVNNDGFDDVIVGAYGYGAGDEGQVYVLLGSATGISDCTIDGTCTSLGATITGPAGIGFGASVSRAGDVNGDGYEDLIVGAPYAAVSKSYVFLGSAYGIADCTIGGVCTSLNATITGVSVWGCIGTSVDTAGDVNGDGYDDIVVGEPWSATGNAYVFLGSAAGIADCTIGGICTSLSATITGEAADDELGMSVSTAGDVDGDGYDDVIVGADLANSAKGEAYIFSGSAAGIADCTIGGECPSLSTTITGAAADDSLGVSASAASDVDGDGYADIIVGAYGVPGGAYRGAGYIFLGSNGGVANCTIGGACPSLDATITGALVNDLLGFVR